jgi:glucose-6-phosphate dehydrogenase assembly protein OpcA
MSGSDFLSGMPVAVDPASIEVELARLWKPAPGGKPGAADEASGGMVARVCLANLLVFLPDAGARERASEILPEIARSYPGRMILLVAGGEDGRELEAWVTAVCHLPAGAKVPVCCEQITLRAPAGRQDLLAGIALSLLVPDVPLNLLLTFGGGEAVESALRSAADRFVYDSRRGEGAALRRSLRRVRDARRAPSFAAEDLAWWEILPWREFLAEIFDEEAVRPLLDGLRAVEVTFAGEAGAVSAGGAAPAALAAGWIASRLGWRGAVTGRAAGGVIEARVEGAGGGSRPALAIRLAAGAAGNMAGDASRVTGVAEGTLLSLRLDAGDGFVEVARVQRPEALAVRGNTPRSCVLPRLRPLRPASDAQLVGRILEAPRRSTSVFREALDVACRLLDLQ